jgi:hypothetical protein
MVARRVLRYGGWRGVLIASTLLCVASMPSVLEAGVVHALSVKVKTTDTTFAGTDDMVSVVLLVRDPNGVADRRWDLIGSWDPFEQDAVDVFNLTTNLPDQTCNIVGIRIEKAPDSFDGGWKLSWFDVMVDGNIFFHGNVDDWLEGDDRTWWSPLAPTDCEPPPAFVFGELGQPLPDCTVNEGSTEFPARKPDADCDGIANDKDTTFNPPDSDGDGLYDPNEDLNHNGVVDPGETDPHDSDTDKDGIIDLYDLPDSDSDCLPDIFEDRNRDGVRQGNETDKFNPDTDGDGWNDGACNVRTQVFFSGLECINRQEEFPEFHDEIFVTFNHTRWPMHPALDGFYSISDGHILSPAVEIARRTRSRNGPAQPPYSMRVDLREDDWFDWTDDDLFTDRDVAFTENSTFAEEYLDSGFFNTVHYKLHFVSVRSFFPDPHALSADNDDDHDGLSERREFDAAAAMDGVADPALRDIYMELDSVGSDQVPERYSKEDICSRLALHGYSFHLDDGVWGGGQVLPYIETVAYDGPAPSASGYRAANMAAMRCGLFHYALAVDVVSGGARGRSERALKDGSGATIPGSGNGDLLIFKSDWLDHISDAESIIWLHEFGHNLGLCHLPGDPEPIVTGVGGTGGCANTLDITTRAASGGECECTHYSNTRWNRSAMGSGGADPEDWIQGVFRTNDYSAGEWAVVDLTPLKNAPRVRPCL